MLSLLIVTLIMSHPCVKQITHVLFSKQSGGGLMTFVYTWDLTDIFVKDLVTLFIMSFVQRRLLFSVSQRLCLSSAPNH